MKRIIGSLGRDVATARRGYAVSKGEISNCMCKKQSQGRTLRKPQENAVLRRSKGERGQKGTRESGGCAAGWTNTRPPEIRRYADGCRALTSQGRGK